jgi:hypothetical protein
MSLPFNAMTPARQAWTLEQQKANEILGAIPGLSRVPGTFAYFLSLPGDRMYMCIPVNSYDGALRVLLKHLVPSKVRDMLKRLEGRSKRERHRKEFHHL